MAHAEGARVGSGVTRSTSGPSPRRSSEDRGAAVSRRGAVRRNSTSSQGQALSRSLAKITRSSSATGADPGGASDLIQRIAALTGPGGLGSQVSLPTGTIASAGGMVQRAARRMADEEVQRAAIQRRAATSPAVLSRGNDVLATPIVRDLVRRELAELTHITAPAPATNAANLSRRAEQAQRVPTLDAGGPASKSKGNKKSLDDYLNRMVRRILREEQILRERGLVSRG